MTNKIINNEIEKLVTNCRTEESKILIGKYQLCVNQWLIHLINDYYNKDYKQNHSINYLRQLLRKSPSIKIIGDKSSLNSSIYLSSFVSCVYLELIRISFKQLIGLENIRSQLKCLSCIKSFDTQVLDEGFWDLFGVWPVLTSLKLSQSNITSVNASIIPSSVQTLDLSWNRIKRFNNIANYSVNSITKLDLSYNALNVLPQLNHISCDTLKTLHLRANLIENIDGIEKLSKLEELDIAFNCLIDSKSTVSSLRHCKSLRILWIDGNPFTCDRSTYDLIKQELPQLRQLDEIKFTHSSAQTLDHIKCEEDNQKMNSDQEYEDKSFDTSFGSQTDTNNPKKKKSRVVQIRDITEIDEELEQLMITNDNHKKHQNLSETKDSIIQMRRELGDEWLSSLRPSFDKKSFLSSAIETSTPLPLTSSSSVDNDSDSHKYESNSPIAESISKVEYLSNDMTEDMLHITNDDEIEILTEEKSEWSRKELEDDSNIIIVECPDTNEAIFLYVREEDGMIFEKDCVSGKVLRNYDLKVLTSVEIINNCVLKLTFDSRVNSKRERKYVFDDIDSCQTFNDKFIIPWISQKPLIPEELYECLKCGLKQTSELQINCCPNCGSDVIMKNDSRRRRSGSDITILSQIPSQTFPETMPNVVEEPNVWDQMFSVNNDYNNSFFTRVDHSLKLFIEVKLIGDDEVVEGLVKCKSITGPQNKLESSLFVICSKKIMIITVNENENNDDFESNLKLNISKPISSLIEVKHLPHLLINQGFWFQWREPNKQQESKSMSLSFMNRFSSKPKSSSQTNSSYNLIVFDDELIGKSFLCYFNETISKLSSVPNISSNNQKILINENWISVEDELIIIQMVNSVQYKRSDMKSELKLTENIAIIVTEKYVILGEIHFDPNVDNKVKVLYKELIINLMPQICINIKSKVFKLSFSEDNIETQFVVNVLTTDSIKKILAPVRSQWEKAFDVSIPLHKF